MPSSLATLTLIPLTNPLAKPRANAPPPRAEPRAPATRSQHGEIHALELFGQVQEICTRGRGRGSRTHDDEGREEEEELHVGWWWLVLGF